MSEQPAGGVPEWDLADRMRKALRHAGMTPGEMAAYLGVGGNTVSTWINGRITPSWGTLRLWAGATGVSLGWLAGGDTPVLTAAGFKSRASWITPGHVLTFPDGILVAA